MTCKVCGLQLAEAPEDPIESAHEAFDRLGVPRTGVDGDPLTLAQRTTWRLRERLGEPR